MSTSKLFEPISMRDVTLRNRIGVAPMCQYSADDGLPAPWHLVHLGSRAVGGAGLVMAEATAVVPEGRITPGDTGIWTDSHIDAWKPITAFIAEHGSVPAIQLAHAGWKASTAPPWKGGKNVAPTAGGWQPVGVTDRPFTDGYPKPRRMTLDDIKAIIAAFATAARRSLEAGFKLIEIHAAHGYLLHSFYSPLSNDRTDDFGGSFENRTRLLLNITDAVRKEMPDDLPLAVRLSCTDWTEGGWTIDDSVAVSKLLKERGVDLVDCSSGGAAPGIQIPTGPGYQVELSAKIRQNADIKTAAVGMITDPIQSETILRTGQADLIFLAREMLRDPYWPTRAASTLGAPTDGVAPVQYARAW